MNRGSRELSDSEFKEVNFIYYADEEIPFHHAWNDYLCGHLCSDRLYATNLVRQRNTPLLRKRGKQSKVLVQQRINISFFSN